jgi:hypothetical protein
MPDAPDTRIMGGIGLILMGWILFSPDEYDTGVGAIAI